MAKTYRKQWRRTKRHPDDNPAQINAQKEQRKMALIWETLARAGVTPSLAAARMAHLDVRVTPVQAEIALAFAKHRNHLKQMNSYV